MKLKGLAETRKNAEAMRDAINQMIDDAYDTPKEEEKNEFYEDAWMLLDGIIDSFDELIELRLDDYMN